MITSHTWQARGKYEEDSRRVYLRSTVHHLDIRVTDRGDNRITVDLWNYSADGDCILLIAEGTTEEVLEPLRAVGRLLALPEDWASDRLFHDDSEMPGITDLGLALSSAWAEDAWEDYCGDDLD